MPRSLLDLAKRAKIDTGVANIVFVRDRLPEVLKNKVDESHTNWTTFCTAIEMVDKAYIRDGVRKYKEREAKYESLNSRINRIERSRSDNPVSALTTQLSRATISNQQPAPASTPRRISSRQSLPHPSISPSVTTEEEKAAVRASITRYTHHLNTAEGRTAYFEQLRSGRLHMVKTDQSMHAHHSRYDGNGVGVLGECYLCGMQGHRGADCTATGTTKIPPQEGKWRALCGRSLGRNHREQVVAVNQVTEVGEFAWAGYGDDQGNGDGPSV